MAAPPSVVVVVEWALARQAEVLAVVARE